MIVFVYWAYLLRMKILCKRPFKKLKTNMTMALKSASKISAVANGRVKLYERKFAWKMKKLKEKLITNIDPQKFNQFKWSKKVALKDIFKLYQTEAQGLIDEELVDEIGLTFYMRCKQASEVRGLIDRGQMLCLQCGTVLTKIDDNEVVNCNCGYSYTFREYCRSYTAANMPGGRATEIFEHFAKTWPHLKETSQKMS